MYRHIVMFWLKEPTEENKGMARDKLRALAGQIEGLLSVEVELDALASERSCDLCLNMVFASREALDAYRTHPAHLPVQAHMHAVRLRSHAADYPIPAPAKPRMPLLYACLGPACASVSVLERLLDAGMNGVFLSPLHRPLSDLSPWVDALHAAASRGGHRPDFIVNPSAQPYDLSEMEKAGVTALQLSLRPEDGPDTEGIRSRLPRGMRLLATVEDGGHVHALPFLLAQADGLVMTRPNLCRSLSHLKLPGLQKEIAQAARAADKPLMIAADLLYSMHKHPVPTSGEVLDVYNAVLDGAGALMLVHETAIGKYPVAAMETLRKVAEAALV